VANHVPLLSCVLRLGRSSELSEFCRHFGVICAYGLLSQRNWVLLSSVGNDFHNQVSNFLVFRLKEQVRLTGNWCLSLKSFKLSWSCVEMFKFGSITWPMVWQYADSHVGLQHRVNVTENFFINNFIEKAYKRKKGSFNRWCTKKAVRPGNFWGTERNRVGSRQINVARWNFACRCCWSKKAREFSVNLRSIWSVQE